MMPDINDPEYDSPYGYQNPPLPEGNEMTQEYKTLRELDVKPGDVVECIGKVNEGDPFDGFIGLRYFHDGIVMRRTGVFTDGFVNLNEPDLYFRIVSRASCDDIPKLWRDMTDAEKGALLLAHHKGKVIEAWDGDEWFHADCPSWSYDTQYRVRPEPKRETVEFILDIDVLVASKLNRKGTHRITFDVIDGEPDVDSIKMEKIDE